jgi:hypothetical protein
MAVSGSTPTGPASLPLITWGETGPDSVPLITRGETVLVCLQEYIVHEVPSVSGKEWYTYVLYEVWIGLDLGFTAHQQYLSHFKPSREVGKIHIIQCDTGVCHLVLLRAL